MLVVWSSREPWTLRLDRSSQHPQSSTSSNILDLLAAVTAFTNLFMRSIQELNITYMIAGEVDVFFPL